MNKIEMKHAVYAWWKKQLGDDYIERWYLLQVKTNDNPDVERPIAGWQRGKIITLNMNTIDKMKLDPLVVLAHEYGHLIYMPVVPGTIMDDSGEYHVGKQLQDYEKE